MLTALLSLGAPKASAHRYDISVVPTDNREVLDFRVNDNGTVLWAAPKPGGGSEYLLYDGTATTKPVLGVGDTVLLNNLDQIVTTIGGNRIAMWNGTTGLWVNRSGISSDNVDPILNNLGHVVYQELVVSVGEIILFDGTTYTPITSNAVNDTDPDVNDNDVVVWAGLSGGDYEIYRWDGGVVTQITNDTYQDRNPLISNSGFIAWSAGTTLFLYEPGVGISQILTNGRLLGLGDNGNILAEQANSPGKLFLYEHSLGTVTNIASGTYARLTPDGTIASWLSSAPLGGTDVTVWEGGVVHPAITTTYLEFKPTMNAAGDLLFLQEDPFQSNGRLTLATHNDLLTVSAETCDGLDNDHDGQIDELTGTIGNFWADGDGDGYGAPGSGVEACATPPGHVANNGDCDDTDAAIHPLAAETCNLIDDNCDGAVDEGVTMPFYVDADADGHGTTTTVIDACTVPGGFSALPDDCNDADASVSPSAAEACNLIDDNCDGQINEGVCNTQAGSGVTVAVNPEVAVTFSSVIQNGDTTATTSTVGPLLMKGYAVTGSPLYYTLDTFAWYQWNAEVCITYDPASMNNENNAALLVWDGAGWNDITTRQDADGDQVCGVTSDLATFTVAENTDPGGVTVINNGGCAVSPRPATWGQAAGALLPLLLALGIPFLGRRRSG